MSQILIQDLIRQLHELQEGSLWFDQSFKNKLDNLSEVEAFKQPIPQVHSVAEHVAHMLAWRKECLLRFKQQKTELMNTAEDWKDTATLIKIGWFSLKQQLYESTTTLINALKDKDDTYLQTTFQDTSYNFHYLVEGILQHDLYHLGQIGVTLKLIRQP